MANINLTVVVDGGASGSRLSALDASGVVVASVHEGPASLSLGEERAWQHIRTGITLLARECALPADWMPARLCLGLAGALQQSQRERFLSLLPASIDCTLVSDGYAQLMGASGSAPGACLAVGTGSVVNWLDNSGMQGMAGGWGFPAGDEASGAWLGLRLLNAYLRDFDQIQSDSTQATLSQPLKDLAQREIGSTRSVIQSWSICKDPSQLATLVPGLLHCAEQGDVMANNIIADGVQACLHLLGVVPADLPVYLVGGLVPVYRSRLLAALGERLQEPVGDVTSGLYALLADATSHERA